MRELKKPVINNMYFVYTLCHSGVIFYVGKSKDVHSRYRQHLNANNKQPLSKIIKAMLLAGNIPEMNIITYTTAIHAANIEETLIKCLSQGGQKLGNIFGTTLITEGRRHTGFNTTKEALNTIIKRQNEYVKCCDFNASYYIVPTVGETRFYPVKYRSSQNITVHHNVLVK